MAPLQTRCFLSGAYQTIQNWTIDYWGTGPKWNFIDLCPDLLPPVISAHCSLFRVSSTWGLWQQLLPDSWHFVSPALRGYSCTPLLSSAVRAHITSITVRALFLVCRVAGTWSWAQTSTPRNVACSPRIPVCMSMIMIDAVWGCLFLQIWLLTTSLSLPWIVTMPPLTVWAGCFFLLTWPSTRCP